MFGLSSTPTRRLISALVAALFLVALAVPVGAAGPPGNNGTVKIHNVGDPETEPSPEIKNEPHVSCFHVHFFFADTNQSGSWSITGQPPTGGNTGTSGTYDTGAGTSFVTDAIGLAPGHYTLDWQGRNDKNIKHKTFWVDGGCEGGGGGGGEG